MPAPPRWLLAVPDAIRLETLDRDLLTRRDVERLFGVSRARAAQLMRTFGAARVGASRVLRRTALLRQLRTYRQRAAFRGEEARRTRLVAELRQARLTGIRVAVPREAREATASLPDVGRARPDRGALPRRAGRRRAALRARPGADQRLRAVRGARRGGRRRARRGSGEGMSEDLVLVERGRRGARAAGRARAAAADRRRGARGGGEVSRVFRRADRQPADAGGVRASRGAVPGLGRGAGPGAHGGLAAARGGLHPDPPRVGAHRQAAPGGHPHARRLARGQPGYPGEPGGGRAGAEARGHDCSRRPRPAGSSRRSTRARSRPGARLGDALQLRAGERGHR